MLGDFRELSELHNLAPKRWKYIVYSNDKDTLSPGSTTVTSNLPTNIFDLARVETANYLRRLFQADHEK